MISFYSRKKTAPEEDSETTIPRALRTIFPGKVADAVISFERIKLDLDYIKGTNLLRSALSLFFALK